MKIPVAKQKWLEKAYEHFGEYGPEYVNIQKIASEIDLPRTSFYYHFADKDDLCEQLLQRHGVNTEKYIQIVKEQCRTLIPDLFLVIEQFPKTLKFHRQLFAVHNMPEYNQIFRYINKSGNPFIIPLVQKYYHLNFPYSTMEEFWDTVTHTWYGRMDTNQINAKALAALADEIIVSVLNLTKFKS